jgi:acetyl esterase
MPVDAKLQAILNAGKALGVPPIETMAVEEARAERAAMMRRYVPMPEYAGVRVEERTISAGGRSMAARVYRPAGASGILPVVVFFHGGGFVVCTLETHDPYCRALATEAGVMVVSVDYRLAPEHKFPAGVEDCLAATEWVLEHVGELGGDAGRVFVGGDSAGATLATVVALLLRDRGEAGKLAGQILLYPVAGYYDPPTVSYMEMAEGYGLTRKGMT